jgi:hypothetical protein
MPCLKFKSFTVPQCPDAFTIGSLSADTDYVYEFTGKFEQKYRGNVTSDLDGKITIAVDGEILRKDLFQHFSGSWTFALYTKGDAGELVPYLFCDEYTHFTFLFASVKPQPDPNNIVIIGCDESDTGGGSGGGGGIPVINADDGGTLEPDPTGRFYTLTYHNVADSPFSVYIDKQATIDWGDGSALRHYPGDHIITKNYAAAGNDPIEIKVYWEVAALNPCSVIYFSASGTAVLDSLSPDIPTTLWRVNLANGLPELPLADLPENVNYFNLYGAGFTAEKLDELISWARAHNVNLSRIRIDVRNQTTSATPDFTAQDFIDIEEAGGEILRD